MSTETAQKFKEDSLKYVILPIAFESIRVIMDSRRHTRKAAQAHKRKPKMNAASQKQIDYINSLIAQNAKDLEVMSDDYGVFLREFWSKVSTPENATTIEASEIIDVLKRGPNMIAHGLAAAIKSGKTDQKTATFGKFNKRAVKFLKNALVNAAK